MRPFAFLSSKSSIYPSLPEDLFFIAGVTSVVLYTPTNVGLDYSSPVKTPILAVLKKTPEQSLKRNGTSNFPTCFKFRPWMIAKQLFQPPFVG
jgi:hypothetical protein